MNFWKSYVLNVSAVLAAVLAAATLVSALPITYAVNRIIGAGSVTGFIKTDGRVGGLIATDFLDWDLLLFDGTSTFELTGPLSGNNSEVYIQGADTEAFDTYLMFNFSGVDNGIFLFQQGLFSGNHYYCDASQPGPCFPGETVVPISVTTGYQNVELHGIEVIGNEIATTPEPGTCALVLTGAGLLLRNRKRLGFFGSDS